MFRGMAVTPPGQGGPKGIAPALNVTPISHCHIKVRHRATLLLYYLPAAHYAASPSRQPLPERERSHLT